LLPALARARQAAVSVQCLSNLRQIGAMESLYANDNNGWIGVSMAPIAAGSEPSWQWAPFLTGGDACPDDTNATATRWGYALGTIYCTNLNMLSCGAEWPNGQRVPFITLTNTYLPTGVGGTGQNYGLNVAGLAKPNGTGTPDGGPSGQGNYGYKPSPWWNFMQVKRVVAPGTTNYRYFAQLFTAYQSAEHVLMADSGRVTLTAGGFSYNTVDQPQMINQSLYAISFVVPSGIPASGGVFTPAPSGNGRFLSLRHNNGANLLFADGHAEWWDRSTVVGSFVSMFNGVGNGVTMRWELLNKDMQVEMAGGN
jgi:prepilin-type processing-associated H-X9-DG protein